MVGDDDSVNWKFDNKLPGTIATYYFNKQDKLYTDIGKVVNHYSKMPNAQYFWSHNRQLELATVCQYIMEQELLKGGSNAADLPDV